MCGRKKARVKAETRLKKSRIFAQKQGRQTTPLLAPRTLYEKHAAERKGHLREDDS